MAEKIVTVEVSSNGELSVETTGFKGKGCKAVVDAFKDMGKVSNETLKPEYYQDPAGQNHITSSN